MATENEGQHTPMSEGADEGADKKLIFGKYKSLEEAEKAHKELERKFHEGNEKFSRYEERLELLENRDEGYGRGQPHTDFTPQQPQATDSTRILTEFYSNPNKVIADIEERAVSKAEARILDRQQQHTNHAAVVQAWADKNQDVAKYPELLTYWVGQTDGRLSVETRLNKAAEKVRQRVIELRGKPETGNPEPDDVIEGPDAGGAPTRAAKSAPAKGQPDPESQLASYASSRNRQIRKPLGQPREKA